MHVERVQDSAVNWSSGNVSTGRRPRRRIMTIPKEPLLALNNEAGNL